MVTDDQLRMLPGKGIRVLDLSDGICGGTGRILADLGADVIKIEPCGGAPSRRHGVLDGSVSLTFAVDNANKRSVILDLNGPQGRQDLLRLVATADLVLSGGPGAQELPAHAGPDAWIEANPSLVVLEVSYFGRSGPYRDWIGTSDVLAALSGLLAQSGLPGREPLLPPEHLVDAVASAQAAWTAMLALWNRRVTGEGQRIDFAALDSVAAGLDPGFGISGTARGASDDLPRGRPDARHLYPIFRCADGWARICLLSPRQWDNMLEWMGRPPELSDPKYAVLRERHAAADTIGEILGAFFAGRNRDQIVAESLAFGVPAAGLLKPSELLTTPHYAARDTFVEVPLGDGRTAMMPRAYVTLGTAPVGYRSPAPSPGQHTGEVLADRAAQPSTTTRNGAARRPFEGLRVLDLGVIVVGAETGRLFADWGADVIKVENRKYLDGNRQSTGPNDVTQSFARGHRNKRSLGLDLRSEAGREVFLDLVRRSDVVLSNFKPGTLESLGLGYDVLSSINPRVVVADSSAFGAVGPWSRRMGYGPLVRSSTGLSGLWTYPEDESGFSDAITIYPDHIAARFIAVAVLGLLLRREDTGIGGVASVAQTDVVLFQMADRIMLESLEPGALTGGGIVRGGDIPRGVFPCAGDDEWCVIDVQTDDQFRGLAHAIGRPEWLTREDLGSPAGRLARRTEIEQGVRSWTAGHAPREAMALMQQQGVPCGFLQRARDFPDDPHFRARGFLRIQDQPQFSGKLVTHNGEAVFSSMGEPPYGPAPILGEQTVSVCAEVLGMSDAEITRLIDLGVLEVPDPARAGRSASPVTGG